MLNAIVSHVLSKTFQALWTWDLALFPLRSICRRTVLNGRNEQTRPFPQEGFSRVRLQLVADGKTWVQSGRFSKKEGSVSTRLNMSHPILGF